MRATARAKQICLSSSLSRGAVKKCTVPRADQQGRGSRSVAREREAGCCCCRLQFASLLGHSCLQRPRRSSRKSGEAGRNSLVNSLSLRDTHTLSHVALMHTYATTHFLAHTPKDRQTTRSRAPKANTPKPNATLLCLAGWLVHLATLIAAPLVVASARAESFVFQRRNRLEPRREVMP